MPFTPTPTTGDDVLIDTNGDETVDALAGNDTITVTRGFDNVNGNTGRDRLIIDYSGASQGVVNDGGLNGNLASGYQSRIWQGNAAFTVDFSGIEDFTVTTGNSNDNITVGDGDDVINLGFGDDFANFGAGNDSGDGGAGTDGFSANMASATGAISINLQTGGNANFTNFEYLGTLSTGSGNDTVVTRGDVAGNETINTGSGTDTITVARGFDAVNGGADRDRLIIDYSGASQGVATDGGFSGSLAAGFAGRIWQGNGAYTVDFTGIEDFTITTGNSNDNITVGDGDDVINLGFGDDFANFGTGNDSGDGGAGTDGFSANLGAAVAAISIDLQTGVSATFSNFEYLGTLTTGSGNDTVVTRGDVAGNETINSGAGADTITVARGFDAVNGGADRDRLIIDYSGASQGVATDGGFSGSLAAGFAGRIWQGNGAYTVDFTGIEDFTITTGNSNDNITVGDGDDVINLGFGDDFANFGTGNDSGDGGAGTDGFSANLGAAVAAISIDLQTGVSATFSNFEYLGTLTTGSGNDTVVTRGDVAGNETINSGAGADTITVARGFDAVNGGADRDRLIIDYSGASQGVFTDGGFSGSLAAGFAGRIWQGNAAFTVDFSGIEDFTITTGNSNDNITVGDGDDVINLGGGNDTVNAAGGNDLIDGGDGNDTLNGNGGDDTILISAGVDTINGGADNDTVNINYSTQTIGFFNDAGGDVSFSNGIDTSVNITAVERIIIATGSGNDNITTLGGDDEIRTNDGSDTLNGGAGNDILDGGSGADTLDGGSGINSLSGGSGNDRLKINASGSGSSIDGGTDIDTLEVSGAVSLGSIASVEAIDLAAGATLTLTGTQFDTGLAVNSAITGNGSLTINMDAGVNFFATLMSFAAGVGVTVNGTSGIDVIKGALGAAITVNGGDGIDQIRGGNLADSIFGDGGNDKIMGLGGADQLTGGAGADQFRYLFTNDSGLGTAADRILDFTNGEDKLDFRVLDADPNTAGRQALSFIGTAAFGATGSAQLRYADSGGDTLVQIDLNGDGAADMEIVLVGHAGQALTGTDFLL